MVKQCCFFVAIILGLCTSFSCGSYNCGPAAGLTVNTIGFTAAERDTIILRKFVKGSNFSQMIDTTLINVSYNQSNDTATAGYFTDAGTLKSNYDYQLFFPVIHKLVKITDLNEPQQKMKRSLLSTDKTYCINTIVSYTQDGISIPVSNYDIRIFIHR